MDNLSSAGTEIDVVDHFKFLGVSFHTDNKSRRVILLLIFRLGKMR